MESRRPRDEKAKEFAAQVRLIVKDEAKKVFVTLTDDGVTVGKLQIHHSTKRIIDKVIKGDRGRHKLGESAESKIRAFVKSSLVHEFITKVSHSDSP